MRSAQSYPESPEVRTAATGPLAGVYRGAEPDWSCSNKSSPTHEGVGRCQHVLAMELPQLSK